MSKPERVDGKQYDKTGFYWAVMYRKNHIVCIYPKGREAATEVNLSNTKWENYGWGRPFHVKRFKFHFCGAEIDGYEHYFERNEKRT